MIAYLALALAAFSWALGFPLGKVALAELSPAHLILLRFAVASVAALPFALRSARARRLFRSPAVLIAGALYGLAFLIQFEGLAHSTVTLAALLVGAMPALVAVSARLMGEPVSRMSWAGVGGATLGAALIAGKPGGAGSPLGIALMLLALLIFLGWLHAARRAPEGNDQMAVPAVKLIVATLVLLPVTLALHGPPTLALSAATWTSVAAAGLLSTFLATALWQLGSTRVGSTVAGVFINMEPLVGALIGITVFGDHAALALVVGGVLIVIGSVVTVLGERSPAAPTLPIE
ncbi:DMT family transporter [Sphingomonas aracearum]|uniref:DMT family transporter n=1 Tax=Sphingomonas aracearum TaxID=2283317 RepID=A0A369VRR2_9SPHN|nr:DMT family transporter [Sphingomonas aracearum]RDE05066.1 DMT family transporter [Sphingomonas aracearum]